MIISGNKNLDCPWLKNVLYPHLFPFQTVIYLSFTYLLRYLHNSIPFQQLFLQKCQQGVFGLAFQNCLILIEHGNKIPDNESDNLLGSQLKGDNQYGCTP